MEATACNLHNSYRNYAIYSLAAIVYILIVHSVTDNPKGGEGVLHEQPQVDSASVEQAPRCCGRGMRRASCSIDSFICTGCYRVLVMSTGNQSADYEMMKRVAREFKYFFGDA